jgi:hypothetical protein
MGTNDSTARNKLRARARVWCEGCGFAWFGVISAHGLSVLGSCPRCGGQLHFRDAAARAPEATAEAVPRTAEPWQVLGNPTSWSERG